MKTEHGTAQLRTITDDQVCEIAMRISEARALLYLLGTAVQKGAHGITDEPGEEERHGICGLVQLVGQGLSEAFESAAKSSPSENAPQSISKGGSDFSEGMVEIRWKAACMEMQAV